MTSISKLVLTLDSNKFKIEHFCSGTRLQWSRNGFNFQRLVWEVLFDLALSLTCDHFSFCVSSFIMIFFTFPPPPFPPQISTVNAWLHLKKWRKRFVFWEGSHDLKFWRFLEVVARCYRQLRLRGESQQLDWFNTEFSNSCWLFERFMWSFLKIVDVDSQHYLWQYFEDGSTQRSCVSRFRVPYK